jgi:hypothetical protein
LAKKDSWEQMDEEPTLWFLRFDEYRRMGLRRSVRGTWDIRRWGDEKEVLKGKAPSNNWHSLSVKWQWKKRAGDYDKSLQSADHEAEEYERQEARNQRLQSLADLKSGVLTDLQTAGVGEMDEKQAKAQLPQLRMMYFAILQAERLEYGEATDIVDDSATKNLNEDIQRMLEKAYGNKRSPDAV